MKFVRLLWDKDRNYAWVTNDHLRKILFEELKLESLEYAKLIFDLILVNLVGRS